MKRLERLIHCVALQSYQKLRHSRPADGDVDMRQSLPNRQRQRIGRLHLARKNNGNPGDPRTGLIQGRADFLKIVVKRVVVRLRVMLNFGNIQQRKRGAIGGKIQGQGRVGRADQTHGAFDSQHRRFIFQRVIKAPASAIPKDGDGVLDGGWGVVGVSTSGMQGHVGHLLGMTECALSLQPQEAALDPFGHFFQALPVQQPIIGADIGVNGQHFNIVPAQKSRQNRHGQIR